MKIVNCFIIIIILLFFSFIIPNKIIKNSIDYHLETELNAWKKLFKWCFDNLPNTNIFCIGGQVLALQILKYLLNEKLSKYNEFFSLDLINDWDINMYMTEIDKNKFTNFAKTLNFEVKYFITNQKSDKNFNLIRFKNKIKKEGSSKEFYLIELKVSLKEMEKKIDEYELPFTSLGFKLHSRNIELFFEIVKITVKNQYQLINEKYKINKLLSNLKICGEELVDSIENGLYNIINSSKISTAYLGSQMLELIDDFLKKSNNENDLTMKQFLITQLSQPDRLFLRFLQKNVKKSRKITKFYIDNKIPLPNWLLNEKILPKIITNITLFLDFLNKYINSNLVIPDELLNPYEDSTKEIKKLFVEFIRRMEMLFMNINLSKLQKYKINKIDKLIIGKLFPLETLVKIKIYGLKRNEIINTKILENLPENKRINVIDQNNFDYTYYLPSGKGKYLSFMKFFLLHNYKK
jgi:hypothetical protein